MAFTSNVNDGVSSIRLLKLEWRGQDMTAIRIGRVSQGHPEEVWSLTDGVEIPVTIRLRRSGVQESRIILTDHKLRNVWIQALLRVKQLRLGPVDEILAGRQLEHASAS